MAAAWEWLERDALRALLLTIGGMLLTRAVFIARPLESDEGGFLLVADQWHSGGTSLYGDQWVDRPPLLLLIYKVAAAWDSSLLVNLLAAAANTVLVAAAWWVGRIVNDSRGAVAAALVAVAGSNIILRGLALTGELIAGSFVMVSCALILQATYKTESTRSAILLALLGGVFAAMAFLVKQNFVDAGLFALVLLGITPHKTWRIMLGFGAGVALPLLTTAV